MLSKRSRGFIDQHDRWPRVTDGRYAADGKASRFAHEIGVGTANFLADYGERCRSDRLHGVLVVASGDKRVDEKKAAEGYRRSGPAWPGQSGAEPAVRSRRSGPSRCRVLQLPSSAKKRVIFVSRISQIKSMKVSAANSVGFVRGDEGTRTSGASSFRPDSDV